MMRQSSLQEQTKNSIATSGSTPDSETRQHRVRALNDALRRTGQGGRVMMTAGVAALPETTQAAVRVFAAFTPDNDPHGEHDFGAVEVDDVRAFWKIDAYDRALQFASPDPSDPAVTMRVLMIMLAEATEVAAPNGRADRPTPGPWLVRGEAGAGASALVGMLGVEPAVDAQAGGGRYLIRSDQPIAPGSSPLHVAIGIERLVDAKLMAAAPELAEALFRLLTAPDLLVHDLDPATRRAVEAGWELLVRAAPYLEI